MSRELTPYESYLFEKQNTETGGDSLFDFMEKFTISYAGSQPKRVYSEEEIATRKTFGFIGKFMGPEFMRLHQEIVSVPGAVNLVSVCNTIIEDYVNDIKVLESSHAIQWFLGNLDSSSATNNDKAFAEWILENFKTKDF